VIAVLALLLALSTAASLLVAVETQKPWQAFYVWLAMANLSFAIENQYRNLGK